MLLKLISRSADTEMQQVFEWLKRQLENLQVIMKAQKTPPKNGLWGGLKEISHWL